MLNSNVKKVTLSVLLIILSLALVVPVAAQTPCDCWKPRDPSFNLVPFAHDYTTGATPQLADFYRNDDAGTNEITLPFHFCFWGKQIDSIFINNNGYITF